jgi:coiled-coil domain-containing protein 55
VAPKYIGQLLSAAKAREREQEVVFERRQVKERQKEDHLFGDKDKFVTAAYKAKLAEDAKWLAEEQAREAAEAAADVTKRRDLSGFYANLMTRNAAFGGAAPAGEALEGADAAPAQQQQQQQQQEAHPSDEARANAAPPSEEDRSVGLRDAHAAMDDPSSGAREPLLPEDGRMGTVSAGPVEPPSDALADAARAAAQSASAALLPSAAASRVKASEEAVAEARERYLARKRARVDEPT